MAKKLTPTEWVTEINAIAAKAKKKEVAMGTTVRVLIRCVLAGPDHKAIGWCNPGDIVDVASGAYLQGLKKKGIVTTELEVPQAPESSAPDPAVEEPDATSSARKLAEELGVDLSDVEGSGSGGRILKGDVEVFAQSEE